MRCLFAVLLSVLGCTAAFAAHKPQESWGKAGITMAQYREDALECGLKGHYSDISRTQDAMEFVRASRQLDAMQGTIVAGTTSTSGNGPADTNVADQVGQFAATQGHIIESVRPQERYRNIKKTLEFTTAECLVQRGYSRFTLTDDQRRRLGKLTPGSDQRRAYLFGLARDPAVLASQKAAGQP